jgi:hypothetical protein
MTLTAPAVETADGAETEWMRLGRCRDVDAVWGGSSERERMRIQRARRSLI